MVTLILAIGLSASVMAGRHVMARLVAGHPRPLQSDPSPVPAHLLLAAQVALPVLGFLLVDATIWIAILILVIAVANAVPSRPLGAARMPVELTAIACAVLATLALLV